MKKKLLSKSLVIGIIVLFIGAGVYPSSGIIVEEKLIISTIRGNTLYVGGRGPDNYTRIQDAINDAVNGDTVFVYAYSSPYYEHLIIDKSINLFGENKETTIIDGNGSGYVVTLAKNGITLSGFTIQKGGSYGWDYSGVRISSNYNTVNNNKILSSGYGIMTDDASNNVISNNTISGNGRGVMILEESNDNLIIRNTIIGNSGGISLRNLGSRNPSNNIVTRNNIKDNPVLGIATESQNGLVISLNNIENSESGIKLITTQLAVVKYNNFIGLETDAFFLLCYFTRWSQNYWGRSMIFPKVIYGLIHGSSQYPYLIWWVNFDFRPAIKPYDITKEEIQGII